ncbi:MAG: hypothetical protein MK135_07000, partial [Polyangiaceae bacterium]|nr:hypothetical protein [Polyangiaceae bacterium]
MREKAPSACRHPKHAFASLARRSIVLPAMSDHGHASSSPGNQTTAPMLVIAAGALSAFLTLGGAPAGHSHDGEHTHDSHGPQLQRPSQVATAIQEDLNDANALAAAEAAAAEMATRKAARAHHDAAAAQKAGQPSSTVAKPGAGESAQS